MLDKQHEIMLINIGEHLSYMRRKMNANSSPKLHLDVIARQVNLELS